MLVVYCMCCCGTFCTAYTICQFIFKTESVISIHSRKPNRICVKLLNFPSSVSKWITAQATQPFLHLLRFLQNKTFQFSLLNNSRYWNQKWINTLSIYELIEILKRTKYNGFWHLQPSHDHIRKNSYKIGHINHIFL